MLKDIFKEEIPVRSDSRISIPSKYSFPEVEMALNSSKSGCIPLAMAFPLLIETGASGFKVDLIFSRNKSQLCRLSPIAFNDSFALSNAIDLIGMIASND